MLEHVGKVARCPILSGQGSALTLRAVTGVIGDIGDICRQGRRCRVGVVATSVGSSA